MKEKQTTQSNHITETGWEKEFVEKGADLEHERWSNWQKYLHSLCIKNEDGTLTIPKERVERWERQINTPYSELSEQEKEYDRIEVRKYLPIISQVEQQAERRVVEELRKVVEDDDDARDTLEEIILLTKLTNK